MRYLMIVRVPEDADPTPEEADADAWFEAVTRDGTRLAGERLRPPSDATTVRAWDGETVVTHGPFAEVAEQIAGFDLLEVESLEHAVAVAQAHPVARFGTLELRELWPHAGRNGSPEGADDPTADLLPGDATYLLLMASTPDAPQPRPADVGTPTTWIGQMRGRDADRGGSELRPPAEAVTVRVRDGRTVLTHGPFAEIAEQVAGYHLLDLPDLDGALEAAGAHPAARHGVIEVRPLWPF